MAVLPWQVGLATRTVLGISLVLGLVLAGGIHSASGQADSGLSWELETVRESVYATGATSLVLDSEDRPHIAYADGYDSRLHYAYRTLSGWRINTVPNAGHVQGRVSLALDGQDRPHISFYDAASGTIRHAFHTGFSWLVRTVDRSHYQGDSSLALDPEGTPYVAYAWFNGELRLARLEGGSWMPELVDGSVVTARFPDLAFGPDGIARVAYYGMARLLLSELTEYGWVRETVDEDATPHFVDLAIGIDGLLAIGYRDEVSRTLRFAWWNGTGWAREVVAEGDKGWDARLVLDASERAHVSHYDREEGQLIYAIRREGTWIPQVVDAEGVVGWWSSLAVAPNWSPYLAYYSWSARAIRFAQGTFRLGVRTWTPEDVGPLNATLRGELMGMGSAREVDAFFEWREAGGEWQSTAATTLSAPGIFLENLETLSPNEVYEARAAASTPEEVVRGETITFKTGSLPSPGPWIPETILVASLATAVLLGLAAYLVAIWRRKAYE